MGRGKQILVGGVIITVLTIIIVSFLICWRLIPGWVGDSFGMIAGLMSTPFLMEGSFLLIGLLIVIALNIWRRHKEGDECVFLEDQEAEKRL